MKKVGDLLFILAVLLAGCCTPILLADFYWAFDLFSSLLPQAVLASFLILILAILIKQKSTVYVSGVTFCLMFSLAAISIWFFWQGPATTDGKSISVLSANVLSSNTQYDDMIKIFEREDPDILVLTEVNDAWAEHILASSINKYPYQSLHPREDNFGMAVFSRLPFKESVHEDEAMISSFLNLRFDAWALLVAHPIPPMSATYDVALKNYFQALIQEARDSDVPVAVAGDFNSTLWSSNMKPFRKEGFKTTNYKILGWTWPDNFPLFAVQIDHILIKDMSVQEFDILEGAGSDHFPVKAVLTLSEQEKTP